MFQRLLTPMTLVLSALAFGACNATDGTRFVEQINELAFSSNTSSMYALGAIKKAPPEDKFFRCPSFSGLSREGDVTTFYSAVKSLSPSFQIFNAEQLRADVSSTLGISVYDLPLSQLDIYERCGSISTDRYLTACPSGYSIVERCESASEPERSCVQIQEGSHRLVLSASYSFDLNCYGEEQDRSPYTSSVPSVAYACDAFEPIEVLAAYRGSSPNNDCCDASATVSLDFCVRPCTCRTLNLQVLPKDKDNSALTVSGDGKLRLAVFSNVESHFDKLESLLDSIQSHQVDHIISLGNLSKDGKAADYLLARALYDQRFLKYDGQDCASDGNEICCNNGKSRKYPFFCNAVLQNTPFWASLGENEKNNAKGLEQFQTSLGVSYYTAVLGNVQLILLDTADAKLSSYQTRWLLLTTEEKQQSCSIPEPSSGQNWPTLSECTSILGVSNPSCRDCIGEEAYCVPPDLARSDYLAGPQNCICVPARSKICLGNKSCSSLGSESSCICTRDQDCALGGRCVEGSCKLPLRLAFSYTPLFDTTGLRNNAFVSRNDTLKLLSYFISSNIQAVFSGRILDYAQFKKGGIQFYITGGGGAPMVSFVNKKHHWLLVEIDEWQNAPTMDKVRVKAIEF